MPPIMDEPTALASTIVPARRYGVRPDTGSDMTAAIQLAFDNAPTGCTLCPEPGTYIISNTVWLSRLINLDARGVLLDLGTSNPTTTFKSSTYALPATYTVGGSAYLNRAGREATTIDVEKFNTAAFVWGTSGGNRPQRTFLRGLRVKRTASATGPAGRKHCGIVILSAFECRLEDTYSENFFGGLLLTNNTSQGTVYNYISKHTSWNDRYPFNLYAVDGGWVNQNTFQDCRLLQGTGAGGVAEGVSDPGPIEYVRVMMHSASGSRPNNNEFNNCTFEGGDDKVGRKLRLEGSDHLFLNDRWEGDRNDTETLTNGALTGSPPSQWTAGGDFALSSNAAVFTPASGTGTLTQTSANFATPMVANRMYRLLFTSSGTLPEGMTVEVSGITDTPKEMFINASTTPHGVDFLSGATPGDLVITMTVPEGHIGTITLDGISLLRIEPQFTIGAADGVITAVSNWQRNIFIGGDALASVYEKNQIEYLNSGTWLHNQGNTFITGRGQETSQSGTTQFGKRSAHRLVNASSVHPILGLVNTIPDAGGTPGSSEFWAIYPSRTAIPWAGVAMQVFCDASGVARAWFGMHNIDPWDLRTWTGLNIANLFRVRADSNIDAIIQNPSGGLMLFNAASRPAIFYSGNTSGNEVVVIGDSARDPRITLKAAEAVGGLTYTSAILLFDDDSVETLNDTDVDNSPSTRWSVTGSVAITTLATCTGDGTLTQTAANFALPIRPFAIYKLTFDLVNTGYNGQLQLSGITGAMNLPTRTGSYSVIIQTQSAPTDFILTFIHNAGTLTIDNISLTSPTLRNVIGLHPSSDLGGTGFRPALISNGLWVNQSQSNADSRVSSVNLLDLMRFDADADAVIIGAASGQTGIRAQVEGRTYWNGGQRMKRTSVTDVTLDADHFYVVVDTSGAARTVTMPATDAATIGAGKMFVIKRSGATNAVTITPNGSNTTEVASLTTDGQCVTLVSNGGAGAAGRWESV